MIQIKNLPRRDKVIAMGILLFISVIIVIRFSGIPDQYNVMFAFFDEPSHFTKDFYLSNSIFFNTSYYFSINKFLGLHRNEIVSFLYYLVAASVAAVFMYRIITKHFGVENPLLALLILSFVCVLARAIPVNTWNGIIPLQPGTGTMFAKTMGVIAIYYMLERSIWISSVIITLTISIHILGDIILLAIMFFYIIFNKEIDNRQLAALILPIVFVLYKKLTLGIEAIDADSVATMYSAVMTYTRQDADFLVQSKAALAMLVVSFFIAPYLWKALDTVANGTASRVAILKSIYAASLCIFLGATLYTGIGYKLYLSPSLVGLIGLAPVRAMNYYTLFFYLSVFVITIQSTRLTTIEKATCLLALVLLHAEGIKGFFFPSIVLVFGFMTSRICGVQLRPLNNIRGLVLTSMALLIGLTSLQLARGGKYYTTFNQLSWQHMKRWRSTGDENQETWDTFSKIKQMPGDFSMLPLTLTKDGRLRTNTYMNIYARKSHFIVDGLHFYFKPKLWNEHLIRSRIYEDIINAVGNKRALDEQTITDLRLREVTVVIPDNYLKFFGGWREKKIVDRYILLNYID